jgi:hypothetical protein
MKRRGKGEGLIRQRSDGRWEARLDLGRDLDGKRMTRSVYAWTQADVVRKAHALREQLASGELLADDRGTASRNVAIRELREVVRRLEATVGHLVTEVSALRTAMTGGQA